MNKEPTVFLFPGQGSQYVGMGKELMEAYETVRVTYAQADDILKEFLSRLILNGPEEKLRETVWAQPAILTLCVAISRVLREADLVPIVTAGHSLGEYASLVLSEAMSFEEAIRLVQFRGRVMQEAVPLGQGSMSAILGMPDEVVEEVCQSVVDQGHLVEPANYNCPGQLVISGTKEGIAIATEELKRRGLKKSVPLSVSAPFHCSLLQPAGEKLALELRQKKIQDPKIPYVANVDCEIIRRGDEIADRLVTQVWKPVRWSQSLQKIIERFSPKRIVEVGPGKVIAGHIKKIAPSLVCEATDSLQALRSLGVG